MAVIPNEKIAKLKHPNLLQVLRSESGKYYPENEARVLLYAEK